MSRPLARGLLCSEPVKLCFLSASPPPLCPGSHSACLSLCLVSRPLVLWCALPCCSEPVTLTLWVQVCVWGLGLTGPASV